MTNIEKEIYAMLEGDKDGWTMVTLTDLYVRAHNSTHRVYSRIGWSRLHETIKRVRGQQGLDHVRRAAIRQQ
jgi:hypothetical protein